MIRINQLVLPAGHGREAIKKKAARLLKIPEAAVKELTIVRRSLDARKKGQLLYSYIIDLSLADERAEAGLVKKAANVNIRLEKETPYRCPEHGTAHMEHRPLIIGAGPAGLFAALSLAENGYAPLLIEQGDPVEIRMEKVEQFWKYGPEYLDPHSNVQFGEGGAGTFSDGKLNTLVKDASGRNKKVLETFAEAGADGTILYDSRPHIGTDVLCTVVQNIRKRILENGGEVRFRHCVSELLLSEEGGEQTVCGVKLADGNVIHAGQVILAVGHSARELFEALYRQQIAMRPKPFAVGLRIQHPQKMINLSQYGMEDPKSLGAAAYKLTARTGGGRGVYSFCMCPGGFVVDASSEAGRLAVNGMSCFSRDGENANSALIVTVTPEDFPGVLGGLSFQRCLEEKAFLLGNGRIPIQLYGDFVQGKISGQFGDVGGAFCGRTSFANLRELLPECLNQAFMEGMEVFGRQIAGFDRPDAVLAGVESRTSSPLCIVRDDGLESSVKGLFPCGEGAGYAGGITSAAMDGLKVAEQIIERFAPPG